MDGRLGQPIHARLAPFHDARAFAVADDTGDVALHDLDTGARTRLLGNLGAWVLDVTVSDDDRLVAAVDIGGQVAVWSAEDGARVALPQAPAAARLEAVRFTHRGDRLLLAGNFGSGGGLRVVGLRDGGVVTLSQGQGEGAQYGQGVDVSQDDRLVAVGYWGGAVEVRHLDDGRLLWRQRPSVSWSGPVAFVDGGRALLVSAPEGLFVYDVATGRLLHSNDARATDVSLSPDGRSLVSVNHSQSRLRRFRVPDLAPLDDPGAVLAAIDALAFSSDGAVLAAASTSGPVVRFLDVADGSEVARLGDWPCTGMGGVRFSRDDRLVLVSSCRYDEGLSVFSWPDLRPVQGLQQLATNGEGWFTADGAYLVVMDAFGFSSARAWTTRGRSVPIEAVPAPFRNPAGTSHPDVVRAQWGHRSVLVTHWLNQQQPHPPGATAGSLDGASNTGGFTADGTATVTLGDGFHVRRQGQVVASYALPGLGARSVAISPDGSVVAVGFADGAVRLYRVGG